MTGADEAEAPDISGWQCLGRMAGEGGEVQCAVTAGRLRRSPSCHTDVNSEEFSGPASTTTNEPSYGSERGGTFPSFLKIYQFCGLEGRGRELSHCRLRLQPGEKSPCSLRIPQEHRQRQLWCVEDLTRHRYRAPKHQLRK